MQEETVTRELASVMYLAFGLELSSEDYGHCYSVEEVRAFLRGHGITRWAAVLEEETPGVLGGWAAPLSGPS